MAKPLDKHSATMVPKLSCSHSGAENAPQSIIFTGQLSAFKMALLITTGDTIPDGETGIDLPVEGRSFIKISASILGVKRLSLAVAPAADMPSMSLVLVPAISKQNTGVFALEI